MKNGSDNLVDIQIAIDAAKKTVRFDINYYGEIIWQEIKSVKQYKSIGGGYYETYYSPEWTRTTEERANELFAEFGLNTEIICKMVFANNTDTTTEADTDNTTTEAEENTAQVEETEQNTVEENVKADTTADNREPELIKHNGVSFEGFLATNAGLTIEEYRARKDEQQAEAERRTKIFNLKDGIASTEYKINETSGTLNDIIKNHYRPESDDGSWDEYTAELGDTLATAVSTLNTLKAQLAEYQRQAQQQPQQHQQPTPRRKITSTTPKTIPRSKPKSKTTRQPAPKSPKTKRHASPTALIPLSTKTAPLNSTTLTSALKTTS